MSVEQAKEGCPGSCLLVATPAMPICIEVGCVIQRFVFLWIVLTNLESAGAKRAHRSWLPAQWPIWLSRMVHKIVSFVLHAGRTAFSSMALTLLLSSRTSLHLAHLHFLCYRSVCHHPCLLTTLRATQLLITTRHYHEA